MHDNVNEDFPGRYKTKLFRYVPGMKNIDMGGTFGLRFIKIVNNFFAVQIEYYAKNAIFTVHELCFSP